MNKKQKNIARVIVITFFHGLYSPASKLLLEHVPPMLLAAFLYLGAGFGITVFNLTVHKKVANSKEAGITRREIPFFIAIIALAMAAPILFATGLETASPANASLLVCFEIASTAAIAMILFRETVGRRMWIALLLITISSAVLTIDDASSLSFSSGSVLVLLSCLCWGLENNIIRKISIKDPSQIAIIKGLGAGICSLILALVSGERASNVLYIVLAMLLGFFTFGLSSVFYVLSQRSFGAARTSAYCASAPFIGVILSFIFFEQNLTLAFTAGLFIMAFGIYYAVSEKHKHEHFHDKLEHEHRHNHADGHHNHSHDNSVQGEHSHLHEHEEITHNHTHSPDLHHFHTHPRKKRKDG